MSSRFYQVKSPGDLFGTRLYLESGSLYHGLLRLSSVWRQADKSVTRADGTVYLRYVMSDQDGARISRFLSGENLVQLTAKEWRSGRCA